MTTKEFEKLKIGDCVKIKSKKNENWVFVIGKESKIYGKQNDKPVKFVTDGLVLCPLRKVVKISRSEYYEHLVADINKKIDKLQMVKIKYLTELLKAKKKETKGV